MAVLAVEDLSKNFSGVRALEDLSLDFAPGLCTGLIGPNGSGKSTLLQIICGLLPPSGGAVILSGGRFQAVKPWHIIRHGMTRTFQDGRLISQMSVLDNLLLAMAPRNLWKALKEISVRPHMNRAEDLLRQAGLWEKRHALAGGLSYGQKKLLEIARAIATDADIFLFDEPFSGLFPEAAARVASRLEELKAARKTIVLIEHDMALIELLCDHVVVLDAGKLLMQGPPARVLSDPALREAYLGE